MLCKTEGGDVYIGQVWPGNTAFPDFVTEEGRAWWGELFFWSPSLQLRDADGHRLYLESWLWDATTRSGFVEAVTRDAHS